MFFDSINLAEGSNIGNFNVAKGTSFPQNANEAELFFRTDTGEMHVYDGTEWVSIGTGTAGPGAILPTIPKITSVVVTDSSYNSNGDTAMGLSGGYVKIIGTGFEAGCVAIIGTTTATSTTFVSATEVRAQVPALSAGTYIVYLVNSDGGTAIRVNAISYSAEPSWVTDSTLPSAADGGSISIQFNAATATSYALQAGSTLPTGLTLTSGGLLSGTITGVDVSTQFTFTVVATDAENQDSARTFTITITSGDVYFQNTSLLLNTVDNTFNRDASTNNFPVTVIGDARPSNFSPLVEGYYSNFFDGTGDYLTTPSNAAFAFGTGDYTIECWVYPTSASNMRICEFSDDKDNFEFNASNSALNYYNGSVSVTSTGGSSVTNLWSHVAIVRSSGTVRGYINGVQVLSQATTPDTASARLLHVGGITNILFNGYISNLRVVKGTALYTSNFTPSTTPLTAVAGTSLLTCQSNRFIDRSSNNFTLTRNGDVTVSGFDPFLLDSNFSSYGSAYFDGTGDYLSVPTTNSALHQIGDWTYEGWIYWVALPTTGYQNVFGQSAASQNSFGLYAGNATSLTWSAPYRFKVNQANIGDRITGTTTLVAGQWYHFAVVKNSGVLTLYVNGAAEGTFSDNSDYTFNNNPLTIGDNSNCFISNFRFTRSAVYTSAFTPPAVPLMAIANSNLLTCQSNVSNHNNGIVDSSSLSSIVTRVGNVEPGTFSPYGEGGWSTFFDGTGDYLNVPSNAAFAFGTGNFTVEGWINYAVPTNSGVFQISSTLFALQTGIGLGLDSSLKWMLYYGNGASTLTADGPIRNRWYHFAVVRNSGTTRLYIDGVATSISVADSFNYTGNVLGIAGIYSTSYLMNGFISNFRVVKGTALYTSNFTPSTTPLTAVAGTSLLTCQSNRFIDNSANNFTLTRNGDARTSRFNPFGNRTMTPVTYSTFFDGTDDFLSFNGATVGTNPYTIECWFYHTGTFGVAYALLGTSNSNAINVRINNSTTLAIDQQGVGQQTFTVPTMSANTWYHLAFVRDASNLATVFLNGTRSTTGAVTMSTNYSGASNFIGRIGSNYFPGQISNLRVVIGSAIYNPTSTNITIPTSPLTVIPGTSLLTCQSSTLIDNSSNNFAITANGDARPTLASPFTPSYSSKQNYSASTFGGSLYFDGTGDYLTVPYTPAFNIPASVPVTFEAWVYTTSATDFLMASRNWNWGSGGPTWGFYLISGVTPRWSIAGTGSSTFVMASSSISGTLGQWNHYAFTRDSAGTVRIFVNGRLGVSRTDTQAMTSTSGAIFIGDSANTSSPDANGYVSGARLIIGTAVYTTPFVPPLSPVTATPNTVMLLDGTSAGIRDMAAQTNVETVGNAQVLAGVAKFGTQSIYFDGTGDSLAAAGDFRPTGDFTIEGWIYPTAFASSPHLFAIGNEATSRFIFGMNSSGVIQHNVFGSGSVPTYGAVAVALNTWSHIAIVRSGTTISAYINGVLSGTNTVSGTIGNSAGLYIGGTSSTATFRGYMQDVRVTAGFARYTAPFTPPSSSFPTK